MVMFRFFIKKLCGPAFQHPSSRNPTFRCICCFSTSITEGTIPKPPSVVEFNHVGFSSEEALKASKTLNESPLPQQPELILGFLKRSGFDDTQIKNLVSRHPKWLLLDEETLQPKFKALQDLGFSGADLAGFIIANPFGIFRDFEHNLLPKIVFWIGLLGSFEALIKLLKNNRRFLKRSLEKTIIPNIMMLRECGIPDIRIRSVVKHRPSFILQKPDRFKALAVRVEKMGVPQSSGMFFWALSSLQSTSVTRFNARLKLMKSLGWSKEDFNTAFCKNPLFLTPSLKVMKEKMEFLVNEVGCEPSYVANHPVLLSLSLEKRLIPRHWVLQMLKLRGLGNRKSLTTVMCCSDKKFINDFVLCHLKEIPELLGICSIGRKKKDGLDVLVQKLSVLA
ncbi:mTERF domain-containing protein mitochondrial protein [Dioscorea alata]|uniref:mTERF domain-containing protein mitochondrial protein n=1 Tax=Dioscorea alata TaxID=55571 RepID=A0ACB7W8S9_DIOAL|nr:mTERF domain-containing protein mitochondrial protein [Dioscorea alata]